MATTVTVQKLPDQVTRALVRKIVRKEISEKPPSEIEICEEYGVSKIVAREVLSKLVSLRLITVRSGKRMVIRPQEEWDFLNPLLLEVAPTGTKERVLEELLYIRELLEPSIVSLAAKSATPEQIERIEKVLADMKACAHESDHFYELDYEFHSLLAEASQNMILAYLIKSLQGLYRISMQVTDRNPIGVPAAIQDHEQVMQALKAGDEVNARKFMEDHLQLVREGLRLGGE